MKSIAERLDLCRDFKDVFKLVKISTERCLGRERAGLMLYLARLPKHLCAFHAMGTNGIVLNRNVLDMVTHNARSIRELNSYVYSMLLHEYLHALGYVNEADVRSLVQQISMNIFGPDHPATLIATKGPAAYRLPEPPLTGTPPGKDQFEVIPDLEGTSQRYIA